MKRINGVMAKWRNEISSAYQWRNGARKASSAWRRNNNGKRHGISGESGTMAHEKWHHEKHGGMACNNHGNGSVSVAHHGGGNSSMKMAQMAAKWQA
jgi:hypothetical protein